MHIRGEDLNPRRILAPRRFFKQEHGYRICLFSGRTPNRPTPQRIARGLTLEQFRDYISFKFLKHCRISEEAGDSDEQVVGKRPSFLGMLAQILYIAREVVN